LDEQARRGRFEAQVLPHLDAAFNLARWLMRNHHDAEDVVQDACTRAYQFLDGLRGDRARPWLLAIVRNCAYSRMEANRKSAAAGEDELLDIEAPGPDPESAAARADERRRVNQALARLPVEFREVLVLREIEELSYREIAQVAGIPIGTVMSRLSRGRQLLINHFAAGEAEGLR
jgi:RNA polymerase sigma-70 factor (ECF subfamily)